MLNKNDPLIGAVQEVMKRNQAERDAVNLVNEKFGVTDRKALPHEQQSAWDAAYKQVLSEGISVERVPVSKTPPKILPKTQPGTSVQGGEGIQGYDKQSRSAGSVRPKGDNPKVNMEEEALGEEQIDEVLDSSEKRMKYGLTALGSYVKASLTGDKNTKRKRLAGNKNYKKKVAKAAEKSKDDAYNNKVARQTLIDMGNKTGSGIDYSKIFKEEALDEKKMTKGDIAALKHPREKITGDDLAALRAGEHKMEESDVTSPSSMGIKPDYASGTPDYANRGPQMVNRAAKTSAPAGTVSGTVKEAVMNKVMKKLEEKAVSQAQQKAAGAALAAKRGDIPVSSLEGASKKMMSMSTKELEKFARTKHKGLPEKVDEGFNGRHGLSVTASAEKQAVAGQLNERLSSTAQRKAQLAPTYTQGIKQTRARLAREPAEPKKSFSQRAAEVGRGVEATARGAAAGVTDFGQTNFGYKPLSDYALDAITPGRGENLKREFPTLSRVAKDAGEVGSMATGIGGLVKGGTKAAIKSTVKNAADDVARTTTQTAKTATAAKSATQAADELSPATKERMSRYIEKRVGDRPSSTAKPTSRAAREPATSEPKNAIQKAIRDAEAERNAAKTIDRADRTPNTRVASPDSPIRKAIEKANTSRAAREPANVAAPKPSAAPQAANRPYSVAGAQAKALIKPVIPKTQSGVPSMVGKSRVGPSKVERVGPFNPVGPRAPARPTTPNAAAANAARQRMSASFNDKTLKGAVAVGAGALALKAAQQSYQQSYAPKTASAASTVSSGPSYEKTGRGSAPSLPATSTAQGPSYEKTGRGSAPSLPAKQPASSAASASASAPPQAPAQPVRKAAPQDSSTPAQRAQFNRQIDRGIAAPGTQYKGLGVKTGTTIKQAPAPAVKRPVGTGREK